MTSFFRTVEETGPNQRWCKASVSFISPGGGTIQTSNNVVGWRSPFGGTGGEVCRLRLHLVGLLIGHLVHKKLCHFPEALLQNRWRQIVAGRLTNRGKWTINRCMNIILELDYCTVTAFCSFIHVRYSMMWCPAPSLRENGPCAYCITPNSYLTITIRIDIIMTQLPPPYITKPRADPEALHTYMHKSFLYSAYKFNRVTHYALVHGRYVSDCFVRHWTSSVMRYNSPTSVVPS